jgi:predicted nucleic acid-binding protein
VSCVLDASIGIKWFVDEPDSREAERILTLVESIRVPDLFAIEVAASLTKHHRGRQITSAQLDMALSRLQAIASGSLIVEPTSRLVGRSAEMSRALHHSLYDCVYLALAESRHVPLMTADRIFAKKVADSEWLGLAMSLDEVGGLHSPER